MCDDMARKDKARLFTFSAWSFPQAVGGNPSGIHFGFWISMMDTRQRLGYDERSLMALVYTIWKMTSKFLHPIKKMPLGLVRFHVIRSIEERGHALLMCTP